MGKKRTRKAYTSKGERRSIVAGVKDSRRDMPEVDKALNKIEAWRAGKNPWVTIPGPSKKEAFVRARANAVYGDPKFAMANLFKSRGDE